VTSQSFVVMLPLCTVSKLASILPFEEGWLPS
jgi:hypothetical protein